MLADEAAIVARVKEITQTGPDAWARKVETKDYLASVTEEMQHAPAVYVVYDGLVVFDADEQRSSLGNRWLVVIAVATAAAAREAAPRNQEAGPFMGALLAGLHGFMPDGKTHGMVPVPPPRPFYSEGGKFAYYPLAFVVRAYFSKRFGVAAARATS